MITMNISLPMMNTMIYDICEYNYSHGIIFFAPQVILTECKYTGKYHGILSNKIISSVCQ